MVRRIQVQSVILAILTALLGTASAGTLVSYSFDDDNLATGPDTFSVFRNAKGIVSLSSAFRYSGYSSIKIQDEAGDEDFPELQGYFALRNKGVLYAHFAFLTTDPQQEMNIALAGPQWFTLRKNGIAFWMKTEEGFLYHVSDSIPKKLFLVTPFVWYLVDVRYDIDAGTYDLVICHESKQKPILSLLKQKNASNQPKSEVDKFSFIGDTGEDTSKVVYYVDDVVVGTDEAVIQRPFVAPGRRKLFIDSWNDCHKLAAKIPNYIPPIALADFGISAEQIQLLKQHGALGLLGELIADAEIPTEKLLALPSDAARLLQAIGCWNAGRRKLESHEAVEALALFERALTHVPSGRIYDLYAVLALVSLGRWEAVDLRLSQIYAIWQDDPRFGIFQAMVGIARNNLDDAERWLRNGAEGIPGKLRSESLRQIWNGSITPALIKEIRIQFPDNWPELIQGPLVAEQYFFVLLWKDRFVEAQRFASRMVAGFRHLHLDPSKWQERTGDAAFLGGSLMEALQWYNESLAENQRSSGLLKVSDVYFRLGDLEHERIFREKVYGSLDDH